MSFYPPIPISFAYSGDKNTAVRLSSEGRKRAEELYNSLSQGYSNPFYEKESRLFSGRAGPFLYLTDEGYLVTINVRINGNLTYADIDAVPYTDPEQDKPPCECCRDCLTIGTYSHRINATSSIMRDRHVVDICRQPTEDEQNIVRLIDGIYTTDGNNTFVAGEKYLIISSPALNMIKDIDNPSIPANVEMTTNLRTWDGKLNGRQAKIWQVFNCMEMSDVATEGVDLREVGIDNDLYTVSKSICTVESELNLSDPDIVETPEKQEVKYLLTSIRAEDCFRLLA